MSFHQYLRSSILIPCSVRYDADRKINGLVYLQKISDGRFGGQSKRNLRMFRELCGSDTYKNVVVLTTFWDNLADQSLGERREWEMKSKYFQPLVEGGATFMRHDCSLDSAQRVLDHIIPLIPADVAIVKEIRVEGKKLEDTGAGSVRMKEVELLIAKHKKEIAIFKAEIAALKSSNEKMRQELEKEKAELQEKLAKWEADRASLSRGLETEKMARKTLPEGLIQEHEQSRMEQEKVKINLISILRIEKTAREELQKAVADQQSLISEPERDQAKLKSDLESKGIAHEKLVKAVEKVRDLRAKHDNAKAALESAREAERIAREESEKAAEKERARQEKAALESALQAERIAREELEKATKRERAKWEKAKHELHLAKSKTYADKGSDLAAELPAVLGFFAKPFLVTGGYIADKWTTRAAET